MGIKSFWTGIFQTKSKTTHIFWKNYIYGVFLENIEFTNIDILLETYLYNNEVKIQNKYNTLYEKGFHIVHDLFDTLFNEFISYKRITNGYSIKIPFSTNKGLKRATICVWPNVQLLSHELIIKPSILNLLKY